MLVTMAIGAAGPLAFWNLTFENIKNIIHVFLKQTAILVLK